MNTRKLFEALLEGKKMTNKSDAGERYIYLNSEGKLMEYSLSANKDFAVDLIPLADYNGKEIKWHEYKEKGGK